MEKRFDVRVPKVNTQLLEHLTEESGKTGIPETRLLVLYATRYVESLKQPSGMMLATVATATATSNGQNGHSADVEEVLQSSLSGDALDSLFGDPD